MRVEKAGEKEKVEMVSKLKDLSAGDVFRFEGTSLSSALYSYDTDGFFMVVDVQPKKAGRVNVVSVDGKSFLERDDDRRVIKHDAVVVVGDANGVPF